MKLKTIIAASEKTFDRKVNEFITDEKIEVVKIDFQATIFYHTAFILYK